MIRGHVAPMIRFGLVGSIGVIVNMGVLALLYSVLGTPLWLASAIAIELAILSNFAGHTLFTFRRYEGRLLRRFGSFQAISLITAVLSWAVLNGLALWFGATPEWIVYAYNLVAIGVGFLSNYALNRLFTWRVSETSRAPA